MKAAPSSSRIVVVDCLRGFALMGLFIVHMVEYFELYWYNPEPGFVHNAVFFLFGGKAYAIFALLFGLSFFIIMDNQAKRGVDFRKRFSWRLVLLCLFGYLHSLLYSGDILQILAISGFLLVLVYPLSNRWILLIAAACLLQLPQIIELLIHVAGDGGNSQPVHWSLMAGSFEVYANGSLEDVLSHNVWRGQMGKWAFSFESGRLWVIFGLFLTGFLLGRIRFFENYRQKLHICWAALAVSVVLIITSHTAKVITAMSSHDEVTGRLLEGILTNYQNTALTAFGVLLFILAYEYRFLQKAMNTLAPCGRMSLTIYMGQSLFGVPLYYGFGLGLFQDFGQWYSLVLALVLWGIQMVLAHYWMSRYYYGPMEWLWRSATYMTPDVRWRRTA